MKFPLLIHFRESEDVSCFHTISEDVHLSLIHILYREAGKCGNLPSGEAYIAPLEDGSDVYKRQLLNRLVPLMTKKSDIICMTPSPLQTEQCENKWKKYVDHVKAVSASPYGEWDALEKAAEEIKNSEADLIVLDCIGYTQEMKKMFAEKTGKKVVLPRTLLARVVSELTDI